MIPRTMLNMVEIPSQEGMIIPFEMRDDYVFDETFRSSKQKFSEEARRMDDVFYDITTIVSSLREGRSSPTDSRVSPLKSLSQYALHRALAGKQAARLQFDVSTYAPDDVKIQALNNLLTVTAVHEEKTDAHASFHQYYREYKLPTGVEPSSITAVVSRDGVLTLEIPLPQLKLVPFVRKYSGDDDEETSMMT